MVERFHADPRVQATELLLQERVPRDVGIIEPRPLDEMRVAAPAVPPPVRRYRSPHTTFPHTQFLSNGHYVTSVTNAGGGGSTWRGTAGDAMAPRCDARRGRPVHLPARRAQRRCVVRHLSAVTARARRIRRDVLRRPGELSPAATRTSSTQLDIAVSTEDDVEVRRITLGNHGTRIREIDVTSYAEIVLARPRTISRIRRSASSSSKPSTCPTAPPCCAIDGRGIPRDAPAWAFHALSLEGRPQGPVEWETDRARFLGRGRSSGDPIALDGRRALGHDRRRARSDRQPSPADPASAGRHRAAQFRDRAWPRIARPPKRSRGSTTIPAPPRRTFALAADARRERPSSPGHLGRRGRALRASGVAGARHRRLASRERRRHRRRTSSARPACGRTRSPATCPSCSSASSATTTCRWCGRCCRRRSTGGSRG